MSLAQYPGTVGDMAHDHHHDHHHSHDAADFDWPAMAESLDLDGEVLHEYLSGAIDWVCQQAGDRDVRHILDFGAGTGNASLALARRYPQARVTAVDGSGPLLGHLTAKARDLGLADRISTVEADLDGDWPVLEPADLAWSSNALHHLADPGRALREILARLRPGGLVAVAEMTGTLRFLPDDLGVGQPGLEARAAALQDQLRAAELPFLGADWAPLISAAGFTDVTGRAFEIKLDPPLPANAGRFAQHWLRRIRGLADDRLSAGDLATLDVLTADDGPASVRQRADLAIRGGRTVWTGRRP
jgi:SAM-dependent methyltransferase